MSHPVPAILSALLAALLTLLSSAPAFAILRGTLVSPEDPIASSSVAIIGWTTIFGDIRRPYNCSGMLIQPRVVITAAHCLIDFKTHGPVDPARLTISFALDSSEAAPNKILRHVVETKAHPDFRFTPTPGDSDLSDVGLALLDQDAPAGYTPAALADANPALLANDPVSIAGFGVTDPNDRIMYSVGVLHKTQAPFLRYDDGGKELALSTQGGGLSCLADSGGPAYQLDGERVVLFGITSHGTGATCDAGEQIYTSVAAYRAFLDSALADWASK